VEKVKLQSGIEPDMHNDNLILEALREGIVVFDSQKRLVKINEAAKKLLSIRGNVSKGTKLESCIKNPALIEFITEALLSGKSIETEFIPKVNGNSHIHAYAKSLKRPALGVLIVLADVTRIKQLQNVRRDFVANVSHELKTPVTSIKGFVETLLDGALENREDTRQFLEIIQKQADRLNNIFEDLLMLARIEEHEERGEIALESCVLHNVIESSIQNCERDIQAKEMLVEIRCSKHIKVLMNARLIEEAIGNLITNAVKYSDPRSKVIVHATQQKDVRIDVVDKGCGIAEEHLPRIWERFYRIDPGRSRKLGGTGLGLAIAKHIAQVHRGRVAAASTLGEGSTFSIFLPV